MKKPEHRRIDAFELWCWRRLLRVPWTTRRSNQSILKEISPEYSLEGLMLKLKLQYFGHLTRRADSFGKTLMLGKIEGRKSGGWQRMRWLDVITNSWSPPKPMSIESVMPSNHLILCCSLLLLPSIFPSIRVFSNESALRIRWPKALSLIYSTLGKWRCKENGKWYRTKRLWKNYSTFMVHWDFPHLEMAIILIPTSQGYCGGYKNNTIKVCPKFWTIFFYSQCTRISVCLLKLNT